MLKIKVLSVFTVYLNCLFFSEVFTQSGGFTVGDANVQKSICKLMVKRFFIFKLKRLTYFLNPFSNNRLPPQDCSLIIPGIFQIIFCYASVYGSDKV